MTEKATDSREDLPVLENEAELRELMHEMEEILKKARAFQKNWLRALPLKTKH